MALPQVPDYFGMINKYAPQPKNPLQETIGLQALRQNQLKLQAEEESLENNRAFQQALHQQLGVVSRLISCN